MTKDANYSEARTFIFTKAFDIIKSAIEKYIADYSEKTKLPLASFPKRKEKVNSVKNKQNKTNFI